MSSDPIRVCNGLTVAPLDGIRGDFARFVPAMGLVDFDAPPGMRHTSLPSDQFMLTVFLDDELVSAEDGEPRRLEAVVTVLRSRPAQFVSEGRGQLAMAMLTPEGLRRLARAPLRGIVDRRVPLEWFCGRDEQKRLRDRLMSLPTGTDRMREFARWLETRILDRHSLEPGEARAAQLATAMQHGIGEGDGIGDGIPKLAATMGVTRRQVERDFDTWLGLSPAVYARLVRFQRAAATITAGRALADAAFDSGYADQAHLTRAVRQFASVTPRQLRRQALKAERPSGPPVFAGRLLVLGPDAAAA
jgi:AraC-like DNA-binding protein